MSACLLFSSRRRHTRCALVTGVQTCALPIFLGKVEELIPVLMRRVIAYREHWPELRHIGYDLDIGRLQRCVRFGQQRDDGRWASLRSEEHTSELQPIMRISHAVFCLNKNKQQSHTHTLLAHYKHLPPH